MIMIDMQSSATKCYRIGNLLGRLPIAITKFRSNHAKPFFLMAAAVGKAQLNYQLSAGVYQLVNYMMAAALQRQC